MHGDACARLSLEARRAEFIHFVSEGPSIATGGVAISIRRAWLSKLAPLCRPTFVVLAPGRAIGLELWVDGACAAFVCLHAEVSALGPAAAAISAAQAFISEAAFGIIAGDLNSIAEGDVRMNPASGQTWGDASFLAKVVNREFANLTEFTGENVTRAGRRDVVITTVSRIDRLFCKAGRADVIDSDVAITTVGAFGEQPLISDHVAVSFAVRGLDFVEVPPRIPGWIPLDPPLGRGISGRDFGRSSAVRLRRRRSR